MRIVEASVEDIFVIRSLAGVVFPQTYQHILTSEQVVYMMDMMYSADVLKKQMEESGHHFLLAEDGGEYLGYFSYELNCKNTGTTKIHKIYVLPSAQGKGVGRLFIDAIIDIARKADQSKLSLNVNRFNKAVDFYKRIGFEVAEVMDLDIGNGYLMEDYVMEKIL